MADLGFGIVSSVIANVNRNPEKNPRAWAPIDFMPKYGADAKPPTPKQMKEHFEKTVLSRFKPGIFKKVE